MFKLALSYLFAVILFILLSILFMDYVLLPSYVGYDNEHYLPDLRGSFIEKATYKLRKLGFSIEITQGPYSEKHIPGTVMKMFPRAFTKVKEGRSINLTVAGKDQDIVMPDLKELSVRNVKLNLLKLSLGIDTIIYEYDENIPEDYTTFQLPKAGTSVKSSTKITLGVSRGSPPDYYIVPDLVNLSFRKAKIQILNTGLRVGRIIYEYQPELLQNTVIEQSMTAGMRVSFPISINLTVSKIEE